MLMHVSILYRPNSEHDTTVQSFLRDYQKQTSKDIELISLDTREGAGMAEAYDIVSYPAVLVRRSENGQIEKVWQGGEFPLISELSYRAGDEQLLKK